MMPTMAKERSATAISLVRWLAVASITVVTAVAVAGGFTTALAPLVAIFVLVCPGLALVGTLRLRDPLFEIVLGVALSISIAGLMATIELFTHTWAPVPTLGLLLAVTATALLLDRDLVPRMLWARAFERLAGALRGLRGRSSTPEATGAGAAGPAAQLPTVTSSAPMAPLPPTIRQTAFGPMRVSESASWPTALPPSSTPPMSPPGDAGAGEATEEAPTPVELFVAGPTAAARRGATSRAAAGDVATSLTGNDTDKEPVAAAGATAAAAGAAMAGAGGRKSRRTTKAPADQSLVVGADAPSSAPLSRRRKAPTIGTVAEVTPAAAVAATTKPKRPPSKAPRASGPISEPAIAEVTKPTRRAPRRATTLADAAESAARVAIAVPAARIRRRQPTVADTDAGPVSTTADTAKPTATAAGRSADKGGSASPGTATRGRRASARASADAVAAAVPDARVPVKPRTRRSTAETREAIANAVPTAAVAVPALRARTRRATGPRSTTTAAPANAAAELPAVAPTSGAPTATAVPTPPTPAKATSRTRSKASPPATQARSKASPPATGGAGPTDAPRSARKPAPTKVRTTRPAGDAADGERRPDETLATGDDPTVAGHDDRAAAAAPPSAQAPATEVPPAPAAAPPAAAPPTEAQQAPAATAPAEGAPASASAPSEGPPRIAAEHLEPPPPPNVIVARRLPDKSRPVPPSAARHGRTRSALLDEPDDETDVSGTLRSVVRDVVGDIADHRDGKR